MSITKEQLLAMMPATAKHENVDGLPDIINNTLTEFSIVDGKDIAAFLATIAVESNQLSTYSENLNYSAAGLLKTFPKYFTQDIAEAYEHQPEKIANRVYANRMGNGNEKSGDGYAHRGLGAIQSTGKDNQTVIAEHFGIPVENISAWLQTDEGAIRSAGLMWHKSGAASYALTGDLDGVRDVINQGHKTAAIGDSNGYGAFVVYYHKIAFVLGVKS